MKKRILAILSVSVLLMSLMPMTAMAKSEHDLSVTKNGVPAVEGSDYHWSGNKLYIDASDLTVTGATTKENISVNSGVANVTLSDFQAAYGTGFYDAAVTFDDTSELILKGNNIMNGTEGDSTGIYTYDDLTISGDGNLSTYFPGCSIFLNTSANLTLNCSGTIILDSKGYYSLYVDGTINVGTSTGRVLACSPYDQGAVGQFNSIVLGEGIVVKGSTVYKAAQNEITSDIDCTNVQNSLLIDGNAAKTVLMAPVVTPTGDAVNMTLWIMLAAVSAIGICVYLVLGNKRKNEQ